VESGRFQAVTGALEVGPAGAGRALTADQSNTSVVLAERLVVKCFRRPALGIHPEPELLAGLTRVGSRRAPAFGGSLVRRSAEGEEALTCLYAFVAGEPVGWESLIERLRAALAAADRNLLAGLAAEAGSLGAAVAELHVDLAAAFGTASARAEDADAARAQAQRQLAEALAVATPDLERALRPRAAEVAAALGELGRLAGSPLTRTHGDLHVAQLVTSPGGPVVVDFEGEPGRPLGERRQLRSPLRDLACLLLSFDHVAAAAGRRLAPTSATDPDAWADAAFAWSSEARRRAGEAYRAGIEGSELRFDERLLRALELEKECHEVIYAATVLPEWSYAPRLTIARLLDGQARE
jgi:maltokinase